MWIPAITAAVALLYAYYRSHRAGRGFEINHVTTFTLGFLFYWLLPTLLGTGFAPDVAQGVMDFFGSVPSGRIRAYEGSLLLFYGMFALGDFLGGLPMARRAPERRRPLFQPKLWRIAWAAVFLVFLAVLIQHRGELSASYSNADFVARGTIVAVTIVLFSVSLRMAIEDRWLLMKIYFMVALATLTLGGRLYFVSSAISVLALISYRKPIPTRTLVVGAIVSVGALGGIGILRMHSQASPLLWLLNIATESLFTSFSLFSYLGRNHVAWINLPMYLAKDFTNLVPSFLVGEKKAVDLTDASFGIASPLGAMNSWVSFNVNFGLIGTAVLLFLFAYLMRRHEKLRVPYLMLTGFTAFTFFRDPFSVSIVKNMFEFSILIPLLMESAGKVATYSLISGYPRQDECDRPTDVLSG